MRRDAPQPQVEFLTELYGADPTQLLQIIRMAEAQPIPKRLMLIGHNPGMHELALMLAGSGDAAGDARRSRTICRPRAWRSSTLRSTTGARWHSAADKLVQFTSPKLLKQTSGD